LWFCGLPNSPKREFFPLITEILYIDLWIWGSFISVE
jgi:hypothetical protein